MKNHIFVQILRKKKLMTKTNQQEIIAILYIIAAILSYQNKIIFLTCFFALAAIVVYIYALYLGFKE